MRTMVKCGSTFTSSCSLARPKTKPKKQEGNDFQGKKGGVEKKMRVDVAVMLICFAKSGTYGHNLYKSDTHSNPQLLLNFRMILFLLE
ncbi:hypothetical protein ACHQM5_005330 [Ranunculus cassubicifolius]